MAQNFTKFVSALSKYQQVDSLLQWLYFLRSCRDIGQPWTFKSSEQESSRYGVGKPGNIQLDCVLGFLDLSSHPIWHVRVIKSCFNMQAATRFSCCKMGVSGMAEHGVAPTKNKPEKL